MGEVELFSVNGWVVRGGGLGDWGNARGERGWEVLQGGKGRRGVFYSWGGGEESGGSVVYCVVLVVKGVFICAFRRGVSGVWIML